MTSLYSHDIILVLFKWIIKQDYKNKYLVTGDESQCRMKPGVTKVNHKQDNDEPDYRLL